MLHQGAEAGYRGSFVYDETAVVEAGIQIFPDLKTKLYGEFQKPASRIHDGRHLSKHGCRKMS